MLGSYTFLRSVILALGVCGKYERSFAERLADVSHEADYIILKLVRCRLVCLEDEGAAARVVMKKTVKVLLILSRGCHCRGEVK